jgi:hypothetical protein
MILGYLANMVATIPTWISMQITQAELDVAPAPGESKMEQKRMDTNAELVAALDKSAAGARSAFEQTTDEHLMTNWQMSWATSGQLGRRSLHMTMPKNSRSIPAYSSSLVKVRS